MSSVAMSDPSIAVSSIAACVMCAMLSSWATASKTATNANARPRVSAVGVRGGESSPFDAVKEQLQRVGWCLTLADTASTASRSPLIMFVRNEKNQTAIRDEVIDLFVNAGMSTDDGHRGRVADGQVYCFYVDSRLRTVHDVVAKVGPVVIGMTRRVDVAALGFRNLPADMTRSSRQRVWRAITRAGALTVPFVKMSRKGERNLAIDGDDISQYNADDGLGSSDAFVYQGPETRPLDLTSNKVELTYVVLNLFSGAQSIGKGLKSALGRTVYIPYDNDNRLKKLTNLGQIGAFREGDIMALSAQDIMSDVKRVLSFNSWREVIKSHRLIWAVSFPSESFKRDSSDEERAAADDLFKHVCDLIVRVGITGISQRYFFAHPTSTGFWDRDVVKRWIRECKLRKRESTHCMYGSFARDEVTFLVQEDVSHELVLHACRGRTRCPASARVAGGYASPSHVFKKRKTLYDKSKFPPQLSFVLFRAVTMAIRREQGTREITFGNATRDEYRSSLLRGMANPAAADAGMQFQEIFALSVEAKHRLWECIDGMMAERANEPVVSLDSSFTWLRERCRVLVEKDILREFLNMTIGRDTPHGAQHIFFRNDGIRRYVLD